MSTQEEKQLKSLTKEEVAIVSCFSLLALTELILIAQQRGRFMGYHRFDRL
jgi:hypothetical protein